eukprot:1798389-Alexandrium_andersonii.AAC.1
MANIKLKNGKKVLGTYVRAEPEGIYDVNVTHRNRVSHINNIHNGEEVLDEDEMGDVQDMALEEETMEVSGTAMAEDEIRKRAAELEDRSAAVHGVNGSADGLSSGDSDKGSSDD